MRLPWKVPVYDVLQPTLPEPLGEPDWQGFDPDLASASDYHGYGMAMTGRIYAAARYEYGQNTQMKSPEIGDGHYTAQFWEYDSGLARRWELDPKPNVSISGYAVFGGNPIVNVDVLGDTTDVFDTKGNKLGEVQGPGTREIHFMKKAMYEKITKETKNSSPAEAEKRIRKSSEYFIGRTTLQDLKLLDIKAQKVKTELGGLMYVSTTHELRVETCNGCIYTETGGEGMSKTSNYSSDPKKFPFVATVHQHPPARPDIAMNPDTPSGVDYELSQKFILNTPKFINIKGGLGIIVNNRGLVFYKHSGYELNIVKKPDGTSEVTYDYPEKWTNPRTYLYDWKLKPR